MNELSKLPRFTAIALAVITFIGGLVTLTLMLFLGVALPGYARADLDAANHVNDSGAVLMSVAAMAALFPAVLVFRATRGRLSRAVTFHSSFFTGLSLLGFCLWATLALFPVLNSAVIETEWSTRILQAVFFGPVLCLFVIPLALLLLGFATCYDNSKNV